MKPKTKYDLISVKYATLTEHEISIIQYKYQDDELLYNILEQFKEVIALLPENQDSEQHECPECGERFYA